MQGRSQGGPGGKSPWTYDIGLCAPPAEVNYVFQVIASGRVFVCQLRWRVVGVKFRF